MLRVNSFGSEIIQFSAFVEYYINEEPKKVSFEQFCYNLLHDKEVKDSFPNVEVALRMYLSLDLMIFNCSCLKELSLAKMREIKVARGELCQAQAYISRII